MDHGPPRCRISRKQWFGTNSTPAGAPHLRPPPLRPSSSPARDCRAAASHADEDLAARFRSGRHNASIAFAAQTLVILVGEVRGDALAWLTLFENVLVPLQVSRQQFSSSCHSSSQQAHTHALANQLPWC